MFPMILALVNFKRQDLDRRRLFNFELLPEIVTNNIYLQVPREAYFIKSLIIN